MKKVCFLLIFALLGISAAASDNFSAVLTDSDIWKNDSIHIKIDSDITDIYGFQCRFEHSSNVKFSELKVPEGWAAAAPYTEGNTVDLAFTLTGNEKNMKINDASFIFKAQSSGAASIALQSVSVINSQLERTDYTPKINLGFKIKSASVSGGGGGGGGSISLPPSVVVTPPEIPSEQQGGGAAENGENIGGENEPSAAKQAFIDVAEDYWAADYIGSLAAKGIITGYDTEEGKVFMPERSVSRGEFAKMITGILNIEIEESENPFEDVNEGDWYRPYICAAYSEGIMQGSGGMAMPEMPVTRQDAAVMLGRAFPSAAETDVHFSDEDEISGYALEYVKRLYSAGIISGMPDGSFNPLGLLKRSEAAAVFARYTERAEQ